MVLAVVAVMATIRLAAAGALRLLVAVVVAAVVGVVAMVIAVLAAMVSALPFPIVVGRLCAGEQILARLPP